MTFRCDHPFVTLALTALTALTGCTSLKPGSDRADAALGDGAVADGGADAGVPDCPALDARTVVMIEDDSGEVGIETDTTWTCANTYVLAANVFVTADAELTVEAGTVVRAQPDKFILVARGSRLVADGTAERPIVFTADATAGRHGGDWRGIFLLGNGATNTSLTSPPAASVPDADIRGHYGGGPTSASPANCGTLRYVRIEFAGGDPTDPVEPGSALTLAGCGRGTTIDYVHVHRPTDGIGLYGGDATLRHIAVTQSPNEAIQWTYGYRGVMQFVVVQSTVNGVGLRGHNDPTDPNLLPRSRPIIYNATLTSVMDAASGAANTGIVLETGTGLILRNSLVDNFAGYAVDMVWTGYPTFEGTSLVFTSITFHGNNYVDGSGMLPTTGEPSGDDGNFDEHGYVIVAGSQNDELDPMLAAPDSLTAPVFVPGDGMVVGASVSSPGDDVQSVLAPANLSEFRGAMAAAMAPMPADDWLSPWTAFPQD